MTTIAAFPLPPRSPDDLDTWLATNPPTDVAIGLVLPVAALLVAYLTVVGVLYVLALLVRAPRAARALAHVTPAGVRALAERAVAVSLLTATWAAPTAAMAVTGAPPPGLRVPTSATGDLRGPALDLPTVEVPTVPVEPPVVAPPASPEPPVAAPAISPEPPVVPPAAARQHTVVPGDHLWGIAARAVADARGVDVGEVSVADVAAYWTEVIRLNRDHLRSSDPDLIHPGEVIRLPAVERPPG